MGVGEEGEKRSREEWKEKAERTTRWVKRGKTARGKCDTFSVMLYEMPRGMGKQVEWRQ